MVRVYDKLWYVLNNKDGNLAYMCPYEETDTGEVKSNIKKMQDTGKRWSGDDSGTVIDNTPTKGLYVGCSVSRWSTSNKLFRVEDPRGFTVEIPTDNLATLLHHTTVIKGVVQEECVWGREGNNHILLPVNSEPYLKAKKDQDTIENKLIPVSELKVGDWVKLFGLDKEVYFFGRVKLTWKVRGYRYGRSIGWSTQRSKDEYSDWYEMEDNKYINIFLSHFPDNTETKYYADTPTKPNIVEVIRNEVIDIDLKDVGWLNVPKRVTKKIEGIDLYYYDRYESEVIGVKYK